MVDIVVNCVVDNAASCWVCSNRTVLVDKEDKLSAESTPICVVESALKFVELKLFKTDVLIARIWAVDKACTCAVPIAFNAPADKDCTWDVLSNLRLEAATPDSSLVDRAWTWEVLSAPNCAAVKALIKLALSAEAPAVLIPCSWVAVNNLACVELSAPTAELDKAPICCDVRAWTSVATNCVTWVLVIAPKLAVPNAATWLTVRAFNCVDPKLLTWLVVNAPAWVLVNDWNWATFKLERRASVKPAIPTEEIAAICALLKVCNSEVEIWANWPVLIAAIPAVEIEANCVAFSASTCDVPIPDMTSLPSDLSWPIVKAATCWVSRELTCVELSASTTATLINPICEVLKLWSCVVFKTAAWAVLSALRAELFSLATEFPNALICAVLIAERLWLVSAATCDVCSAAIWEVPIAWTCAALSLATSPTSRVLTWSVDKELIWEVFRAETWATLIANICPVLIPTKSLVSMAPICCKVKLETCEFVNAAIWSPIKAMIWSVVNACICLAVSALTDWVAMLPISCVLMPDIWFADNAPNCPVDKALIWSEVIAPIWLPVKATSCAEVIRPIWSLVNPLIWFVLKALIFAADKPVIAEGEIPEIWLDDKFRMSVSVKVLIWASVQSSSTVDGVIRGV